MPNGKDVIIHLITGLIKKILNGIFLSQILSNAIPFYKMSQYFPKPYKPFGRDINVKVDLSNYAT